MIMVLVLNCTFNLITVALGMFFGLFDLAKTGYELILYLNYGRIDIYRRKVLVDKIGNDTRLTSMKEYIEREADLEFCKYYAEDRKWLLRHEISLEGMPEEEKFLAAMKRHDFKHRRLLVQKAKEITE